MSNIIDLMPHLRAKQEAQKDFIEHDIWRDAYQLPSDYIATWAEETVDKFNQEMDIDSHE